MTKEKIELTEILEMVEFDYIINNDGTLSLHDQLGANLGGIEDDTFEIDKNLAMSVVDRLSIYIEDYITDGYAETLRVECNEKADKSDTYIDLLGKMKKYPDKFCEGCLRIMEALDRPNELLDVSEIIENSKITKNCFRCGTRLMKSPVEGYIYFCPDCYEDFYEIEQGKDKKCLKDMIFTTEMMNSLANTITKMKLSKMLKGFTTNILQWKKTMMKILR